MIIQNNNLANQLHVSLTESMKNMARSSQKLASGDKFTPGDGTGASELTLSTSLRNCYKGSEALITGVESSVGFAAMQESIMEDVSGIINRMAELIGSALDNTKTTTDRATLESEIVLLQDELTALSANEIKYNNKNLFNTELSVRFGMGTDETLTLSGISLETLASIAGSLCVSTAAYASAALVSLKGSIMTKFGSLSAMATSHSSRIQTVLKSAQENVAHLRNVESKIRNVDVAKESAKFISQQVMVQAGQSIVAQANVIPQSSLIYFNF